MKKKKYIMVSGIDKGHLLIVTTDPKIDTTYVGVMLTKSNRTYEDIFYVNETDLAHYDYKTLHL